MRRFLQLLACAGFAVPLFGCPGKPEPEPGSLYIRGSVSAPVGVSIKGTELVACFVINNECSLDSSNTKRVVLQASGSRAAYSFDGLAAGNYQVIAVKDSNNNDAFDDGDYSGQYVKGGSEAVAVTPPVMGIDIALQMKGSGNHQPMSENVKYLRPEDFVGGKATVTFSSLGAEERVAIIPVHASQSSKVDGFQYGITTSGMTAQGLMPELQRMMSTSPEAAGLQADEASSLPSDAHLRRLEQGLRWAERLKQAGVSPSSRAGQLRAQAQTPIGPCPGPYTVGTLRCGFWIMSGDTQQQITATLRHASANAYWFVQNEDASDFSEAELQSLANDFETKVVPSDRQYFGDFSDVDQNGKIFIIFSRLLGPDGLLGYVHPADLFTDAETAPYGIRSNEGDIFYAATPSTLSGMTRARYFSVSMPSTMVHELKHQIATSTRVLSVPERPVEELWIEEGSAMAAQQLAGLGTQVGEVQPYARYSLISPQGFRTVYASRPEAPQEGLSIYGYNFLLIWRAAERKGHAQFWRGWSAGPDKGIANLEAHTGSPFPELMLDWATTLMLDHTGLLTGYDYQGINLRDGSWSMLGYSPLSSGATGTTRSMSYLVGRGTGGSASITVQALNGASPYAVVARLPGSLPYSTKAITGKVTAPLGTSLQGAVLEACHVVDGKCDERSFKTRGGQFRSSSQSSNYSLQVEPADYIVLAYKDVNGDGKLGAGDYSGCYTTGLSTSCAILRVGSDVSGVDVQMKVLTGLTGQDADVLPEGLLQPRLSADASSLFQALLSQAR
ncbi:hypothetical protein JRI60_39170 [Archangium violaceum]|uniref:hypothetical protein n=1 Tax=Archangium violaceum TaxID=83451 RepID=UPI00194EADD3|nr:hypothetical protein [Archangium violaceum]QRN95060.1 hypothetical protein JRI60_39170 [Archangium violaceum]